MTILLDLPESTMEHLAANAKRTGKGIDELAAEAVISQYPDTDDTQAFFDRIAARVPPPGYVADLSREAIYAD
ncbi:MAG: hypothetical protein ACLQVD_18830 [Capsulimonadaceae bacterium]